MRILFTISCFLGFITVFGQTLPAERRVDWTKAGLRDTSMDGFTTINMQDFGIVNDATTPNDTALSNALATVTGSGAIIEFPAGSFLFNKTISLNDNIIIKGQGANNTLFIMDLGGSGHGISVIGGISRQDTTSFAATTNKDDTKITVLDVTKFSIGDWVQIIEDDDDLVISSWAKHTTGQIVSIKSINANEIEFNSPLRRNYTLSKSPHIVKLNPKKNVGIECLKIERKDNTAPEQSSNIYFQYVTNSWVSGIESNNCTFSHFQARLSSNLHIAKSYFHHGFEYGGDGRAYGVVLHETTGESLVEDNIFEHLRHSMFVQSGANGNVFAFNYSFDPHWVSHPLPSDGAGEIVLHGNYPYLNLFEQNIVRNIVIDDSHGKNGPYNTFLRNRSEGYGIFFSDHTSPDQNFLGNDIPNKSLPYSLVNYRIRGDGHFIHGSNDKGKIKPDGTENLPDQSYYYSSKPNFVLADEWAAIGTPNEMGVATIPARERRCTNHMFSNSCNNIDGVADVPDTNQEALLFPNPVKSALTIESNHCMIHLTILSSTGKEMFAQEDVGFSVEISTDNWAAGIYIVRVRHSINKTSVKKIVKVR